MKEIKLTKGKTAIVDDEDYDTLMQWSWCAKKHPRNWYAARGQVINGRAVEIKMHRQIMGVTGHEIHIDHRDGNGLNNQKLNLRRCSQGQNNMNARKRKNSTSIYKGVSFEESGKGYKKWVAQVYANKKQHHLGRFMTEREAAEAYDKKAIEVHGEFAVLNFDKTKQP